MNHASRTYPEECCGLLLGQRDRPTPTSKNSPLKQVLEIRETVNAWDREVGEELTTVIPHLGTGKSDRYFIDPKDLLNAQRYVRDRGLEIVGIYHSHPDHPAVPSESDRLLAWPEYSYLILSLQQGQVVDWQSWCLDDQHQFQAEEILSVEPA
ncbi:MAG: M67 family metallopeptidase [Oculatellaceae cyanobacterium Prado106]|nr:M67 family metallopeptidase [Oculatellaceae cyanobacterium Prado106]